MIPKELLKTIRRIQITTSRMVTDVFAGQYHSVFKGRGMEFDEVREYSPGDDIRSIDWNVTARMGHPFVKKFVEERELTVMLMLDVSRSQLFGTSHKMKIEIAAEICALIAFSAIKNNDKVGLIIFTDTIEKFVSPQKGLRHVLRVIREALFFSCAEAQERVKGKGTDITVALRYLNRVVNRRAVTFIISDFYAPDYKKLLAVTNKKHDVIAVSITDPREKELPPLGILTFEDAETGKQLNIDSTDPRMRRHFAENVQQLRQARTKIFQSVRVDHIDVNTDASYAKDLFLFFKMREQRT